MPNFGATLVAVFLCLATAFAAPNLASGQEPAAPTEEAGAIPTVSYQDVDASTLRVFAIGNVGTSTLQIQQGTMPLTIATPQSGHGTGFLVGDDGLVLTAQHVIDGASHVAVRLPGQQGFRAARVIVSSKESDIAVLSIDSNLKAIALSDEKVPLPVRQTVFALGYPLDPSRTQAQSSRGIVAGALDDGMVQLDISVNPGNSGGPLVDERHQVVGMVVARGNVEAGVQGLGFAVPLSKLKTSLEEARTRIREGDVRPLKSTEKANAAIVDKLILQGALHSIDEESDLNSIVDQSILEEDLDAFADSINDPDLLVYMAGNLWNAHLVLIYGRIDTIDGKTVTVESRQALAKRLKVRVTTLSARAREIDPNISVRSSFISFVLGLEGASPTAEGTERGLAQPGSAPPLPERQIPSEKTIAGLRGSVLYFAESASIPFKFGASLNVWLKHALSRSSGARTDVLFGIAGTIGGGQDYDIKYDLDSDILSETTSVYDQRFGVELGISHLATTGSAPFLVEAAWTPGSVLRSTTTETDFYSSSGRPDTSTTTEAHDLELLQLRLSAGVVRNHFEFLGTIRYLQATDGDSSTALGMSAGILF
jgi:S1-C subfamily serine protease